MRRIQPVLLHAQVSEVLEDIRQQSNIRFHVQIVIVAKSFAFKCFPNPLRVSVLLVCYVFVVELAVKLVFDRQLCLAESLPRVNVLIWVNSLLEKQIAALRYFCCIYKGILWRCFDKEIMTSLQIVQAVDETKSAHRKCDVFFHVVGNVSSLSSFDIEGIKWCAS